MGRRIILSDTDGNMNPSSSHSKCDHNRTTSLFVETFQQITSTPTISFKNQQIFKTQTNNSADLVKQRKHLSFCKPDCWEKYIMIQKKYRIQKPYSNREGAGEEDVGILSAFSN
jgi:hypothetical protein